MVEGLATQTDISRVIFLALKIMSSQHHSPTTWKWVRITAYSDILFIKTKMIGSTRILQLLYESWELHIVSITNWGVEKIKRD